MNTKVGSFFSKLFGGGGDNSVVIDTSVVKLEESVASILGDDAVIDKAAELTKTFTQFGDYLKENVSITPTKKGEADMDLKSLAKAFGLPETATEADVTAAIAKSQQLIGDAASQIKKLQHENTIAKAGLTSDEIAYMKKESMYDEEEDGAPPEKKKKRADFLAASHGQRENIMKSAEPPLPASIQKIMDDNEKLQKRIADLEAGGSLTTLAKRATDIGLPESEAETLQKARKGDVASIEKIEGFLKAATAQARLGGVFKEFGSNIGNGVPDTPMGKLQAKAEELRKSDPKLTPDQAFSKVYTDPANVDLVRQERAENRPTAA